MIIILFTLSFLSYIMSSSLLLSCTPLSYTKLFLISATSFLPSLPPSLLSMLPFLLTFSLISLSLSLSFLLSLTLRTFLQNISLPLSLLSASDCKKKKSKKRMSSNFENLERWPKIRLSVTQMRIRWRNAIK